MTKITQISSYLSPHLSQNETLLWEGGPTGYWNTILWNFFFTIIFACLLIYIDLGGILSFMAIFLLAFYPIKLGFDYQLLKNEWYAVTNRRVVLLDKKKQTISLEFQLWDIQSFFQIGNAKLKGDLQFHSTALKDGLKKDQELRWNQIENPSKVLDIITKAWFENGRYSALGYMLKKLKNDFQLDFQSYDYLLLKHAFLKGKYKGRAFTIGLQGLPLEHLKISLTCRIRNANGFFLKEQEETEELMNLLPTGDPSFDSRFVLGSDSPDFTQNILDANARQLLNELPQLGETTLELGEPIFRKKTLAKPKSNNWKKEASILDIEMTNHKEATTSNLRSYWRKSDLVFSFFADTPLSSEESAKMLEDAVEVVLALGKRI